ncbi:flagellin [Limnohabitans sp.]|uniref:flagellin N-terminal helical domain-containing protein n=1 Tax=Limnohabitans sp. TaxID=1907725 RepID=UPI0033420843
MGNVVNTNIAATASQYALVHNQKSLEKSMAQLSTGQRINTAADDAAGLTIGNKMTTQIRSLNQAVRNANDGISMLQTADAATSQITMMLVRMRELAIQSANGTNDTPDRDALQLEFSGLQTQLGDTISNTTWNGMNLLAGGVGGGSVSFQVGSGSAESISLPLASLNTADVTTVLNSGSTSIAVAADAQSSLAAIDDAISQIDTERGKWGAMMNRLTYAADNATNVSMNSSVSRSRIMDTDYAQATAEMARAMILNQAGMAMLSQANQQPMYVLALLR